MIWMIAKSQSFTWNVPNKPYLKLPRNTEDTATTLPTAFCITMKIRRNRVNDTYLRAWNSIPPKRPSKLQTFLGKITRNLSLNKWEKLSAEKRGAGQTSLILDELSECIPAEQDAVNTVENMVIRDVLDRFLDELPAETRKIFVRRYFYMSPVKEIADEYGLSESKVTVTLFRTRGKLKSVLEKEGITL